MEKPNLSSEQEAQTVEIIQRLDGQDFVLTQRIEIRRSEAPRKIGHVAMSPRTAAPDSRDDYLPSDDFDMLHYTAGDSDRASRTTSKPRNPVGMSDNFSHDFDAPWYQGRI